MHTDMFGNMKNMVGWEDTEADVYTEYHSNGENLVPLKLNNNYSVYIGDRDCTIAFYKEQITLLTNTLIVLSTSGVSGKCMQVHGKEDFLRLL